MEVVVQIIVVWSGGGGGGGGRLVVCFVHLLKNVNTGRNANGHCVNWTDAIMCVEINY